eukprot:TRINITY_DN8279_c0_g1_i1.p1 TRINITY_DN8279_c0_g1~~TRINITY_DN8279_c0_g1_i1.p1  ORF type:complete len:492 (+),score=58.51 TRINITY_DN8279_c0_g1_i1:192-1667(+)
MDISYTMSDTLPSGTWISFPVLVAGRSFKSLDELVMAFEKVLQVNESLNQQLEAQGKFSFEQQSLMKILPTKIDKLERRWSTASDVLKEDKRRLQQEYYFHSGELPPKKPAQQKKPPHPKAEKKMPAVHPEIEAINNPKDEIDMTIWQGEKIQIQVKDMLDKGGREGWLFDANEIQLGRRLGKGASGATYKAAMNNKDVAVKCVKIRNKAEVESFLREVDVLSSIKHPYVLPFLGLCFKPPRQCWIVMEYMRGGTLNHWLYGRKNGPKRRRSLTDRILKALEVARGMQRLEENKPHPILHRDIKPGNIFIDPMGHARIGDFGLSKRLSREAIATITGETGTYVYMAPEVLRHEVYDNKADVFSWGVMFAELINQRPPYSELNLSPIQIGIAVADEELQPTILSQSCPSIFYTLLQMCCDFDPIMRPSFRQIVQHLDALMPELCGREPMQMVTMSSMESVELRQHMRTFQLQNGGSHHSASTFALPDEQENL